ncbi:electron transport complex protein RnfB [Nitrosospira sp. Nl5]|uniref:electron transport complex subunit RsxB n=1 Tax=Nitrosospira sp. Nl5 TaxID=200120 RepID=UPI000883BFDC|nr:electron transport complex subunit RsxB [Nitrosospira sp. Nl5]SCY66915.1 electron transport complex protein RnfB [Nitrosospira sp. Nl5]
MRENPLIAEIDAILPQTQCRQCGFPGCEPYATAIAEGRAGINQCPPGGEQGIRKLAELLGVKEIPLNPAHGTPKAKAVALIDEQACIGCTLCVLACPVDAIIGATKQMHTVITAECTGCELCVAPCPVDCIGMIPPGEKISSADAKPDVAANDFLLRQGAKKTADRARARYRFRLHRLEREKQEQTERFAQKAGAGTSVSIPPGTAANGDLKKAAIQVALERAKAGRSKITEGK